MLNILWSFIIVFSLIVSLFTGRLSETVNGAMDGASEGVSLCLGLLGMMCMWNGIMKIADKSGVTSKIASVVKPLFSLLFKRIPSDTTAGEAIVMNLTANLMGMGNAATPAGLKAMREMHSLGNKGDGFHYEMALFTVLNTASFQLVPSTLIAMRSAAGSANPAEIILPVWCASACSIVVAVLCAKAFCR